MNIHHRLLLAVVPILFFSAQVAPAQDSPKDQPKEAEPKPGSIFGRTAPQREKALREGGGSLESEAAVVRGLAWLKRNQTADGSWRLDGNFKDKGSPDDTGRNGATALGLLPFLGAGKTHKPAKNYDYDKVVAKGLHFLIRNQDRNTGYLRGAYAHALATIVLTEAYGLTQDPKVRKPAQMAVNYIIKAQHQAGGWRYSPGQAGDLSVTGWQVMALVTAQMAGFDVPKDTLKKAQQFLDSCCDDANQGYGYLGPGSTPTMSAVGLLCRQYLQAWGPQNLHLIKGIDNNINRYPPGFMFKTKTGLARMMKNTYFYYHATQVMHHVGGKRWKTWNEKMRDQLVNTQDKTDGPNGGSWSSEGDAHGPAGGRLMNTSLSLLTLEVYYRHVPLHQKVKDEPPDAKAAKEKARKEAARKAKLEMEEREASKKLDLAKDFLKNAEASAEKGNYKAAIAGYQIAAKRFQAIIDLYPMSMSAPEARELRQRAQKKLDKLLE